MSAYDCRTRDANVGAAKEAAECVAIQRSSLSSTWHCVRVARGFRPFSARQMDALRKRVHAEAADGRYELYKTTAKHEGAIGRKQHGFPSDQELTA